VLSYRFRVNPKVLLEEGFAPENKRLDAELRRSLRDIGDQALNPVTR